jgi:hypothetical protein
MLLCTSKNTNTVLYVYNCPDRKDGQHPARFHKAEPSTRGSDRIIEVCSTHG